MAIHSHDDDEQVQESERDERAKRERKEFDCPSCNANNPTEAPLQEGDEITCNYCGSEYEVKATSEGKLKLREL